MEIYKALKGVPEIEVFLVKDFENLRISRGSFLSDLRLFFELAFVILKKDLMAIKLVKAGHEVYAGGLSGTFEYFQPPPQLVSHSIHSKLSNYEMKLLGFIDLFSRLGRNNIKIAIYASYNTKQYYRIKKSGIIEYVIYPGIIYEFPEVDPIKKEKIIVTLARISRDKNLEVLEEILKDLPYLHYLIGFCDDEAYLNMLRGKLAKSIIIPNATEEEKKNVILKAKILLHSAVNETAPIAFMEAMSYGVIPIANRSGGVPEIIPAEFLYDNFSEAREKVIYYMENYTDKISRELISVSKQFSVEKFHQDIRDVIHEYIRS